MAEHMEYLELISAALDGALSPAEQEKLDAHLAVCPDCRALAEDLKALHAGLSALPAAEPPADLKDRIMAAVAADNVTPFAPKKHTQPWRRWGACAAAVALILVGAYGMRDHLPINDSVSSEAAPMAAAEPLEKAPASAEGQDPDTENGLTGDSVPESAQAETTAGETTDTALPRTYVRSAPAARSETVSGAAAPEQAAPADPGQADLFAGSSSPEDFQSLKETTVTTASDAPQVSLFTALPPDTQPIPEPASADSGDALTEAPATAVSGDAPAEGAEATATEAPQPFKTMTASLPVDTAGSNSGLDASPEAAVPYAVALDAYPRFYSEDNPILSLPPLEEPEEQPEAVYGELSSLETADAPVWTWGSHESGEAPEEEVEIILFRGNVSYTSGEVTLSNSDTPYWAQRRTYSHVNGVPAKDDGSAVTAQEAMGLMADFTSQTGTLDSAFTEEDGLLQCENTLHSGYSTPVNTITYQRQAKSGNHLFTLSTPGSSDPAWYSVSWNGSMVERIQAPEED